MISTFNNLIRANKLLAINSFTEKAQPVPEIKEWEQKPLSERLSKGATNMLSSLWDKLDVWEVEVLQKKEQITNASKEARADLINQIDDWKFNKAVAFYSRKKATPEKINEIQELLWKEANWTMDKHTVALIMKFQTEQKVAGNYTWDIDWMVWDKTMPILRNNKQEATKVDEVQSIYEKKQNPASEWFEQIFTSWKNLVSFEWDNWAEVFVEYNEKTHKLSIDSTVWDSVFDFPIEWVPDSIKSREEALKYVKENVKDIQWQYNDRIWEIPKKIRNMWWEIKDFLDKNETINALTDKWAPLLEWAEEKIMNEKNLKSFTSDLNGEEIHIEYNPETNKISVDTTILDEIKDFDIDLDLTKDLDLKWLWKVKTEAEAITFLKEKVIDKIKKEYDKRIQTERDRRKAEREKEHESER